MGSTENRREAFRFRLVSEDGDDLGLLSSSDPDWVAGQQIQRGDGTMLEVVRVVAAEPDDDVHGYLIVRRLPSAPE